MATFRLLPLVVVVVLMGVVAGEEGRHTNNWAVLVDTSVFWFNYRHIANALSMYRVVKDLGIPDSQIILMLADDMPCNPRNSYKTEMFNNANHQIELYGEDIEVDYRGSEVTVEAFLRVLSGRHPPGTPASKRLDTDDGSNVFVYMTGHGGDQFLKFQDSAEIGSQDIADAFAQMYEKKRYKELLFAIDTCQANTMFETFHTPNLVAVGSSARDENSYSHHGDKEIGVAIIDRFTYHTLDFMEKQRTGNPSASLLDLFQFYQRAPLGSTAGWKTTLNRPLDRIPVMDFFGSVLDIRTGIPPFRELARRSSSLARRRNNSSSLENEIENEDEYVFEPTI